MAKKIAIFNAKTITPPARDFLQIPSQKASDDDWFSKPNEGQLAVDVYQTDTHVVIKSAVAGIEPEDLEISIDNDIVTIRGTRHQEEHIEKKDYFYQECHWGSFSRSIILPVEIETAQSDASYKNGIITIKFPKRITSKSIPITVKNDE